MGVSVRSGPGSAAAEAGRKPNERTAQCRMWKEILLRVSLLYKCEMRSRDLCTVIDGVLEIGIFCQSTCRFLKHLVKFRNWGSKVIIIIIRIDSKLRLP